LVDLFISHAHADADLIRELVKVLELTFDFEKPKLRCTSHPAYGIEYGDDPVAVLRKDLSGLKLLLQSSHQTVTLCPGCTQKSARPGSIVPL